MENTMLNRIIAMCAMATTLVLSHSTQAKDVQLHEDLGVWRVYSDNASQCRLSTTQGDQVVLDVMVNKAGGVAISVANRVWYFAKGVDVSDMRVDVIGAHEDDDIAPEGAGLYAPYRLFAWFERDDAARLIAALSTGDSLEVTLGHKWTAFQLDGVQDGIMSLHDCIKLKSGGESVAT